MFKIEKNGEPPFLLVVALVYGRGREMREVEREYPYERREIMSRKSVSGLRIPNI